MVAVIALVSSLVAAASTVQAGVIPHHHRALAVARTTVPEGWITDIMEPYDDYHTRYLALDCEDKHNTAFFDSCCHPMKANETLATARDADCDPANLSTTLVSTATATSSAASATNVASSSDDEDCDDDDSDDSGDDDDCDEETSSVAATTSAAAATTKVAVTTTKVAETTTKAAKPASTSAAATSSAEPTSKATPTTTKKAATSTKASSTAKATSTAASSSSSSSGSWITGGFATFFYQEGGTGSCGVKNSDSTLLVAVQQDRMESSLCGKKVQIENTANGKTVQAIVQDTCPGCANANSLDLSVAAFDAIGDEATGVLDIKWKFLD